MIGNFQYIKILASFRFWLFLYFLIRLYGITQPPLEIAHNWRQSTVIMVARNFLETNPDIFYPRIDIAGEKTGITGMEFPVFNFMIYLMSMLFGYEHWFGRLINLVFSTLGIFYFHKLLLIFFNRNIAFNSSLILLSSLWFIYSRKIMPDTFSASLVIIGLYFGFRYFVQNQKRLYLLMYFLFITIGILSKIPSGVLLVVIVPFVFDKKISLMRKVFFYSVTTLSMFPIGFWYFVWSPYLVEEFGFWHFYMGRSVMEGIGHIRNDFPVVINKFYEDSIKFIGFGMFIVGLALAFVKRDKKIIFIFGLTFVAFLLFVFKAGYNFKNHSYYMIPFIPVMSLVAGYALDKIKFKKLAIILLVAICIENLANQIHDFRIPEENKMLLKLENDLDKISGKNDLIVINSVENPTPMYFAHRKGWLMSNEQLMNDSIVNDLQEKGCRYLVVMKKSFGEDFSAGYEVLLGNEVYNICKMKE